MEAKKVLISGGPTPPPTPYPTTTEQGERVEAQINKRLAEQKNETLRIARKNTNDAVNAANEVASKQAAAYAIAAEKNRTDAIQAVQNKADIAEKASNDKAVEDFRKIEQLKQNIEEQTIQSSKKSQIAEAAANELQGKLEQLKTDKQAATSKVDVMTTQMKDMQNKAIADSSNAEAKANELKGKLADVKTDHSAATGQIADMTTQLKNAKDKGEADSANAEAAANELNEKLAQLKADEATTTGKVANMTSQLKDLEASQARAVDEIKELKQELQASQSKVSAAEEEAKKEMQEAGLAAGKATLAAGGSADEAVQAGVEAAQSAGANEEQIADLKLQIRAQAKQLSTHHKCKPSAVATGSAPTLMQLLSKGFKSGLGATQAMLKEKCIKVSTEQKSLQCDAIRKAEQLVAKSDIEDATKDMAGIMGSFRRGVKNKLKRGKGIGLTSSLKSIKKGSVQRDEVISGFRQLLPHNVVPAQVKRLEAAFNMNEEASEDDYDVEKLHPATPASLEEIENGLDGTYFKQNNKEASELTSSTKRASMRGVVSKLKFEVHQVTLMMDSVLDDGQCPRQS